ncbi:MAG: hypothetical protein QG629_811 [Patescibacteria group bacterium]|nr:hypothetical protein [Patescibacteria group bacterium]
MTIDEYLANFEGEALLRLQSMRTITQTTVPKAIEDISYGLIGYKLNGKPLVYFGGFANHTGLYATPNGHSHFAAEFAPYKQGKGSVQFPLNQPLPVKLIEKVVQYRKEQCSE